MAKWPAKKPKPRSFHCLCQQTSTQRSHHTTAQKSRCCTLHAANRREEEDTPQNHKQQKEKGREIPRTRTYTLYQPLHMGGLRESWNLIYRTCGFQVLFISMNKNWILLIILHIKRNRFSPQILPKRFSLAQKLFPLHWKYANSQRLRRKPTLLKITACVSNDHRNDPKTWLWHSKLHVLHIVFHHSAIRE